MSNTKAYLLGMFTAYAIYFITRKGYNGLSILDELLDQPDKIMAQAKEHLKAEAVDTVQKILK